MDVEQTETVATEAEPTDAELIAAAQEVGGAASVDVEAEAAAANGAAAQVEGGEPEEPKIAAILRAREKAFAERQEATDHAAQIRGKAEQEAAQILADARAKATADYEREMEARRAKFRESPAQAIREFGVPTNELVDQVAREGTAEWREMQKLRADLEATKATAGKADKVAAEFEAWKEQQAREQHTQRVQQVRSAFLSTHATPDQTPYLHKRYDDEEIFQRADALARKWQAAQVPFDHADVAQYLEHESRNRILGSASSGTPPQQVSGISGGATKVKANGSRTLSAANGSERRTSPKSIDEMTPNEERDALIEAARDARRQNGL